MLDGSLEVINLGCSSDGVKFPFKLICGNVKILSVKNDNRLRGQPDHVSQEFVNMTTAPHDGSTDYDRLVCILNLV